MPTTTDRKTSEETMPKVATTSQAPQKPATPQLTHAENLAKKSRKKLIQRIVLGVVVLLIAIGAYFYFKPAHVLNATIRYSTIERGEIVHTVTATGLTQAFTTVNVGSQVSGTIKNLYADFNTVVKPGQLLAQIDPVLFNAQVAVAKANYDQAQASLFYARADEKRGKELLAQHLMDQSDYDLKYSVLLNDSAQAEQMKAALNVALSNLAFSTIKSPVKGTVQSRAIDVGQTVAASFSAPTLFLIAEDLSKMEVAASVDEADIGQVQEGQDVKFTVEAYPGETFYGKVLQIRINPVTLQNVVTYNVMITTDNSSGKLLPGMTATVNIICATRKDVMKIPSSALQINPPDELVTTTGAPLPAAAKHAHHTGQAHQHTAVLGQGGTTTTVTSEEGQALADTGVGIVYIKAKSNGQQVQLTPVQVTTGLTDGSSTEILSSIPPLQSGDSVVVSIFVPQTTGQTGASPFGGQNSRTTPGPARRM